MRVESWELALRWRVVAPEFLLVAALCVAPLAEGLVTGGSVTGGSAFDNGGAFQLIPAPAVLGNNPYNDDDVRAFDEQQDVILGDLLILDVTAPTLPSNVLAAGSQVSSHYVIFDPNVTETVEGSVTFDEPVLGAIISNARFDDTDTLLGSPMTDYVIGSQGLESPDVVSVNGSTVTFSLRSVQPGDAIRVVTGVDPQFVYNTCEGSDLTLGGAITGGDALVLGGRFVQLCDPIGPVGADNFESFDLFAFEEQQAVELTEPLAIRDAEFIATGEIVSSYYVVWDPATTARVIGTITFPDDIVAVITDRNELQGSEFLGDASATYLNPGLLGLEATDSFAVDGPNLTVDFLASSPGDSVRVILGSASVNLGGTPCAPEDVTLSGTVTGGQAAAAGGTFVQLCNPIGQVGNDNFQSNNLFAYEEQQDVVLTSPLELDEPAGTVLPVGTIVSSYYVAYDPGANRDIVGSITFPREIFGLATTTATLDASDSLGNPSAVYLNPSLRGLEVDEDSVSVSSATLNVSLTANSPGDYVRVIMAGADEDFDGIPDSADNCSSAANVSQLDADGDGYGNACDADLNNDCIVNVIDLGILRTVFFTNDANADLNGDGIVNVVDLGVLRTLFFAPPGPSGTSTLCN